MQALGTVILYATRLLITPPTYLTQWQRKNTSSSLTTIVQNEVNDPKTDNGNIGNTS